ncbi:MAG: hypothetical protein ACFFGZ_19760 [Candidatus Thorarchaeota archaeon]
MPKDELIKANTIHNVYKEEVNSLLRLPGFSNVVKEILKAWLRIRLFLMKKKRLNVAVSSFQTIKKDELNYLDQLANQMMALFENDSDFLQALDQSPSSSYDRMMFRSIRLYGSALGYSLVYPWHIFMEVRHNNDLILLKKIIDNLSQFPSLRRLSAFVDFFLVSLERTAVKRTDYAVKYLQILIDPYFSTAKHLFPTKTDIARAINCSENTVSQFETVYSYLVAVQPRYLVNMGTLGFETIGIIHKASLRPLFDSFLLRMYPYSPNFYLSVFCLPPSSGLLEELPEGNVFHLTRYRIIRNFHQLHAKPEKSWRVANRLLGDGAAITPPKRGIWFSLDPTPNPAPRYLIDFSIIDQVQLVTPGVYADLAASLGISEKHVRRQIEKLLQDEIMMPFYLIIRIGLNTNMLIVFRGSEDETSPLINDLLRFPYIELFSGPEGGIAILKLPEGWVPTLLEDMMHLRNNGLDVWTTLSYPKIARWGIPLTPIARKDDFFGLQWKILEEERGIR